MAPKKTKKPKAKAESELTVKDLMLVNFRKWDKDDDGTLSFEELQTLLRKGDPKMTDDDIRKLFTAADTDGDGVIQFEEFVDLVFSSNPALKKQAGKEGDEKERIIKSTTSTAAWKRASTDPDVHNRLGPITGAYTYDLAGSESGLSFQDSFCLVLHGSDKGYQYELTMLEAMGTTKKLDKDERGVWELSGTRAEVILYNILGNPRERRLDVILAKNKVSGVVLKATRPVELIRE